MKPTNSNSKADANPQQVTATPPAGSIAVEVTHLDGRSEKVFVRVVPRAEFTTYSLTFESTDESAECAFYVGRDREWAGSLTPESFDLVMSHGQRLNFTAWINWVERQQAKAKAMKSQPLSGKLFEEALKQCMGSTAEAPLNPPSQN